MIKLNIALTCTYYILCTRFKLETCGSGSMHPMHSNTRCAGEACTVEEKGTCIISPLQELALDGCCCSRPAGRRQPQISPRSHALAARTQRRAREAAGMPSRRDRGKQECMHVPCFSTSRTSPSELPCRRRRRRRRVTIHVLPLSDPPPLPPPSSVLFLPSSLLLLYKPRKERTIRC